MPIAPTPSRSGGSSLLRQLLPWGLALAVATCTQDQLGPGHGGVGYFSFHPQYHLAGGSSLAQFGIVADSVHIRLTRPVALVVLDTTIFFPADSTSLRLALPIELKQSPETLTAIIEISAGGTVIFRDSIDAEVKDGPPGNTTPTTVVFKYVGPGSSIASVTVIPGDTVITFRDTLFFSATAIDSLEANVPSFYLGWKTSDTTLAKINAGGRLIAPVLRGSVQVIGITPTGIADTTLVTFAPVPVIITADSGSGQLGLVGDSLAALFVARVKGADSLGVSGIPVRFTAVTAGGAVRDTITLITDAQGRVRTRGVLDTVVATNTYSAAIVGSVLPAAVFTATAGPQAPTALAIQGGNGQVDTIGKVLPLPLVARVTDAFGNPVPGARVAFIRIFGLGVAAADTVTSDAAGLASVGYTLGASIGTDTIRAQLVGTSGFVNFFATAVANLPTSIIQGLGGSQSAIAGHPYIDSLTVQVLDNNDNPVGNIRVHWTLVSGNVTLSADSTLTDAAGHTGIKITAGTVTGPVQVTASVVGIASPVNFGETVAPTAAATFLKVAGDSQSGFVSIPLAAPLVVEVKDSFGNVIAGSTIAFTVTNGGGTVDSATATTNIVGLANSGAWTLGTASGVNDLVATLSALPVDTLHFIAVALPIGTTKTWTGLVDNSWGTAGNWSPVGVPTGSDNVFIPLGSPTLDAARSTGDLTLDPSATLSVGSFTLTVTGNLNLASAITGTGTVTLAGTSKTARGTLSGPTLTNTGTVTLNGPLTTSGALNVNAGSLTVGGRTLAVGGALTVQGSGQVVMNNSLDSVDVSGPMVVTTGISGTGDLAAGVLVVRGNFTQTAGAGANFAPSGTHRTRFLGSAAQTIAFSSPGSANSRFQDVEFGSAAGTTLNSTFTAMGTTTVSGGTVTGIGSTANLGGDLFTTYAAWQVSTTLWGASPTNYPDSLPRNVIVFNGWTLSKPFKTDSNLVINSTGVLTLNGHTLRVGGTLTQNGRLVMQNGADTLDVGGAFTVNSGTTGTGDLSAGTLVLRGSFTQSAGSGTNFAPSGTHRTRFLGSAVQTLAFGSPGSASSRFQDVEFGAGTDVTVNSPFTVMGTTSVSSGTVTGIARTASLGGDLITSYGAWQVSTTQFGAAPTVYPDSLPRNVSVLVPWTLSKSFKVDSALVITPAGALTLNGHTVRVGGALTQSGHLVMQNTGDTLDVGGLLTVNSGSSGTGDLTGGVLLLRSGLTQSAGSGSNFQPSGSYLTRFIGSTGQTANFSSPGVASSQFRFLELADSVNFASPIFVAGDVTLLTGGKATGNVVATLAGGLTDPTTFGWRVVNTTMNGTVSAFPSALTTNLLLNGGWTVAQRTQLTGNLTVNSAGALDLVTDTLTVSGSFTQSGTLTSTSALALLDVFGAFTVNSGTTGTGLLSAGHLVLHNAFTQSAGSGTNFAPSGVFLVTFAGSGGHVVSFSSPGLGGSRFQDLQVFDSLSVPGNMTVAGTTTLDPAGRIVSNFTGTLLGDLADPSRKGWRMANTSVPGGKLLPDTMTTNLTLTGGDTLPGQFVVIGNVTLAAGGGVFNTGGHRMLLSGNFTQTGRLQMLTPADTLEVGGSFTVNSGLSGATDLPDGTLLLHGAFTQAAGAAANFAPSVAQVTRFVGSGGHPLSFGSPGAANSHFRDLVVSDSLSVTGNVAVTGRVVLAPTGRMVGINTGLLSGDLIDSSLAGWRMGTTELDKSFLSIPAALTTNLVLADSQGLTQHTNVTGNVTIQPGGYFAPTTYTLTVSGNFTQNGLLSMTSTGDSLDIGGNFTVGSSQPSGGSLSNGGITFRGGFTQNAGATDNFAATGTHHAYFSGPAARGVSFGSPTQSHFAALEIDSTGVITLGSDIYATGALLVRGAPVTLTGSTSFLVHTGGLDVNGLVVDKVRLAMSSPVNAMQFDNVTFTNQDLTKTQLSLTLPGLVGDTLKLHNVAFSGVPTTGKYVFVADSTANSALTEVAFYHSTPLNGAAYTVTDATAGDFAGIEWTTLKWTTQPVDGTQLLPLLSPPVVTAVDPDGVTDPTFTGTVNLTFAADPTAGAAVIGQPSKAAVAGSATFDSLSISLAGTPYRLLATAAGVGPAVASAPFGITIPLPVGTTTAFNNGGGDNNWFNVANWTAGVPDSLDNVFVFPNQTVTIDSAARANRLTIGTGGSLVLNAPLTVDSSIKAGNTISGGGQLIANGTGTISGQVGDLVITGQYTQDSTLSASTVVVDGVGRLNLAGHRLDVIGDFTTQSSGTFVMTSTADSLRVGGTVYAFGGSTTGLLTHGLLQIAGSFYQGGIPNSIPAQTQGPPPALDGFRADSGHTTRFIGGTGPRTIFFGAPVQPGDPFGTSNSRFGRLELINGIDSVASTLAVHADLLVDSASVVNLALTSGGPAVVGNVTVNAGVTQFQISNLSLGGVLDFKPAPVLYQIGTTLFFGNTQSVPVLPYQGIEVDIGQATLSGDISAQNIRTGVISEGPGFPGDLKLGGHKLTVAGNFNVVGQGTFTMDNAADSLDVSGNMDLSGGVNTGLIAGTLVLRGDLYLQDSSIVASGTHHTVFAAAGPQQLWINTATTPSDQFAFLTVAAGATVNFNAFNVGPLVVADTFAIKGFFVQAAAGQQVIALGDLYVGTSAGLTVDTVELHKTLDVDLSTYSVQLTRYAGTGQIVSRTASYTDLEVTGTASLDSTVVVSRDASVRGNGTLDLAGHTLAVARDLTVADFGLLKMTSATDSMNVGYTATFDGRDTQGWLTAGVLTFNYFKQLATTSPNAFRATGTHRAVLLEQNPNDVTTMVQFATPGAAASQFREFELNGGGSGFAYFGAGTIFVADSLYVPAGGSGGLFGSGTTMTVAGPIVVQTGTIPIQLDTLELRGAIQVPYSSLGNGVTRFAGVNQQIPDTQNYNRIEITGTASLETGGGFVASSSAEVYGNGRLTLDANMTFISNGAFATSGNGTVAMTDPTSELRVFGTATFGGGSTAGLLTSGTISLFGDLSSMGVTSDSALRADAAVVTTFDGDRNHRVTLKTFSSNKSALGSVIITSVDTLDVDTTSVYLSGTMVLQPSATLVSAPLTGNPTVWVSKSFAAGTGSAIHILNGVFQDTLLVDPSATYDVGTTYLSGAAQVPVPNLPYKDLVLEGGAPFLNTNLTVAGWTSVNGDGIDAGDLHLNGFTLTTLNFETYNRGVLTMDQGNDSLIVTGNALFRGQSELGKLTAGYILFGGDVSTDTVSGGAPSAFVSQGTAIDLTLGANHTIHFFDPDNSYFPALNPGGAGSLLLQINGRARIAGNLNAYGLQLTGDTLEVDSVLTGGPAGASATLKMLRTGQIYGGTSFSTFAVGSTQFTAAGSLLTLPYDTLIVSDTLRGSYSQLVKANYLEVTGPGNPHHRGAHAGWLFLQGGDGNTTINVAGDASVSGAGATIYNNRGVLTTTGDLLVQQGGLLVATATGCCGTAQFDIGGSATFNGASTRDSLAGGLLRIGKDFAQGGPDPESFVADTGFVTQFMGGGTHRVTFLNPGTAGSGLSHFGELQTDVTLPTELALYSSIFLSGRVISVGTGVTFTNALGAPLELSTAKLDLTQATFNDVTLHWNDPSGAPLSEFQFDSSSFAGFQPSEIQFVIEATATLGQPVTATNITFSPLGGTDTGQYVRVIDTDSPISTTPYVVITTPNFADSAYFKTMNGAILTILPFP